MKKIATLIIMVLMIGSIVYANEYSSTITYTADDSYFIEIPETIVVGEPARISAYDINIADGKVITV